jgi:polyphosphate:AMP phosphotransferase
MFEAAELGLTVPDSEYSDRVPALRERLLEAQTDLRDEDFSVLIVFGGVDKGGKGETATRLSYFMDPRRIITHAYDRPSQEEDERPEYWRFWRDLPPNGHIGIFLRAWYSKPLLQRAFGRIDMTEYDHRLDRIVAFERTLSENRTLIFKFWMHLGKEQQAARFRELEQDPRQAWRMTEKDWRHWEMYDEFTSAAEHLIVRTSRGHSQWTIVEATEPNYRNLEVAEAVAEGIERAITNRRRDRTLAASRVELDEEAELDDVAEPEGGAKGDAQADEQVDADPYAGRTPTTVLSTLDLGKSLTKSEYRAQRDELQGRLNLLQRHAREQERSIILVFEGWDAGGKGGAIRTLLGALDARNYTVTQVAAPTDEEASHHYIWRFWRKLPRAGKVSIFDRSWYGRVLVERVEGFASEEEWRRAYGEINEFERELVDHGMVVVKFWLHVSPEEQAKRFEARRQVAYKRWKLTDEDLRNREKWPVYEAAVHEMVQRTSTPFAPWHLVEGEDKRFARVKVLETVCSALDAALGGVIPESAALEAPAPEVTEAPEATKAPKAPEAPEAPEVTEDAQVTEDADGRPAPAT